MGRRVSPLEEEEGEPVRISLSSPMLWWLRPSLHMERSIMVSRNLSITVLTLDMPLRPMALSDRSSDVRDFKLSAAHDPNDERTASPSDSGRPAITSDRSRVLTLTHFESREEHIVEAADGV